MQRVRPVAVSAYDGSRNAAFALHRSSSNAWDAVSPTLRPYVDHASVSGYASFIVFIICHTFLTLCVFIVYMYGRGKSVRPPDIYSHKCHSV